MPVFMIERRYAEEFTPDAEGAAQVRLINEDEDVRWLYSFLSTDKRKSFACTRRSPPRPSAEPPSAPACPPTWSSRSATRCCPTVHCSR